MYVLYIQYAAKQVLFRNARCFVAQIQLQSQNVTFVQSIEHTAMVTIVKPGARLVSSCGMYMCVCVCARPRGHKELVP